MIRFVNLRGQDTGYRFAFFNTVTDHFVEIDGEQVWDTFAEVEECNPEPALAQRLRNLCPPWALVHPVPGGG